MKDPGETVISSSAGLVPLSPHCTTTGDRKMRVTGLQRRVATLVGAAVAVGSLAACGGGHGSSTPGAVPLGPSGSAPSSGASARSSATSVQSDNGSSAQANQAGQNAQAAYRAAYADWVNAAKTSNYQDLALEHHMSGQALSYVSGSLRVHQVQGTVAKGDPVLRPTVGQMVPAADPTQVVINSQVDDSNWLSYTSDGHLYDNTPGGCHQSQALVVKKDGVWKVDQLAINQVGTC
jgi:hypothetical protein